jgi:hypothetical protein
MNALYSGQGRVEMWRGDGRLNFVGCGEARTASVREMMRFTMFTASYFTLFPCEHLLVFESRECKKSQSEIFNAYVTCHLSSSDIGPDLFGR